MNHVGLGVGVAHECLQGFKCHSLTLNYTLRSLCQHPQWRQWYWGASEHIGCTRTHIILQHHLKNVARDNTADGQ